MSVTIETTDGTTQELARASLRPREFDYDRRMTKVPYQTNVSNDHLEEGSGLRNPERVELIAEVHATEIAKARIGVETIIDLCKDATVVSGDMGEWPVEGVLRVSRQPSENGYILRVLMLAAQPRGADFLRFISGPVWGLR